MSKGFRGVIIAAFLLGTSNAALAQTELCGDPPPVADEALKGEIQGRAGVLTRLLGEVEIGGAIDNSRTEIFSKYPNADERSDAYFEYQICVLLMQDDKLTTSQKIDELKKIRREFSNNSKQGRERSICRVELLKPSKNAILPQGKRVGEEIHTEWMFAWSDCPEAGKYHIYAKADNRGAINPIIDDDNVKGALYIHRSEHYGFINLDTPTFWMVRAYVDGEWGEWSEKRWYYVDPEEPR